MNRTEAMAWVIGTCREYLRLSQCKTLSECVAGALGVVGASLAGIGRAMTGSKQAKYRIRRVWRFVANRRVVVSDAMAGAIMALVRRRRKPLVVALDWTAIRTFCTLMAAAVVRGRAVPLVWASYPKWRLYKSQNNLEEGLLRLLRALVPMTVPVIILADRGFGRTELARTCQALHFHYVIRISPEVWIEHASFRGRLADYPLRRGLGRVLEAVQYRKTKPVVQHVVVHWKQGLPPHRDESWFLMTDLNRRPEALCALYGWRMTIEELFRDLKTTRHGFALRATQIRSAERIDRLLIILALAYWLLTGLGLRARRRYRPGRWSSTNAANTCSAFLIGRLLIHELALAPAKAIAALIAENKRAAPNWG